MHQHALGISSRKSSEGETILFQREGDPLQPFWPSHMVQPPNVGLQALLSVVPRAGTVQAGPHNNISSSRFEDILYV
jgi:hypothetical protein